MTFAAVSTPPRICLFVSPKCSVYCAGRSTATHLTHPTFNVDVCNRSIVRERQPSFQGSFVETCLLFIGNISRVWRTLASIPSDHAHSPVSPGEGSPGASDRLLSRHGSMLDMLLAPPGWRGTCARVSAREAFRCVGTFFFFFRGFGPVHGFSRKSCLRGTPRCLISACLCSDMSGGDEMGVRVHDPKTHVLCYSESGNDPQNARGSCMSVTSYNVSHA